MNNSFIAISLFIYKNERYGSSISSTVFKLIFNLILSKVNYLESIEGLGNLIIKVVPLLTVLSTEIIPPCS